MKTLHISDTCSQCGAKIEIMIFKNTGVCCELCRKKRDGEEDAQPRALNP